MRIETDLKLDYSNVLLRPKRSTLGSRSEVDLIRKYNFRNSTYSYEGIPIIAANMDGVGTWSMHDVLSRQSMLTAIVKHYSIDTQGEHFNRGRALVGGHSGSDFAVYSMGITEDDLNKFEQVNFLSGYTIKYVCIDVANGYSERFIDFVARFRDNFPDKVIMAGNVVTGDVTEELLLRGADIVKVGIGPGSVCTTRIQTGVGYPQLSAVIECADAAHGLGGHIIADGGCTCPGDVVKAFAAGADFVMLGGMLAGHDESEGEVVNGKVSFYGMSSRAANEKHFGGLKEYRSSEGREITVPYRGPVSETVKDLLGGIRSACTYVGARRLKELPKCATFIRCSDTHNRVYE